MCMRWGHLYALDRTYGQAFVYFGHISSFCFYLPEEVKKTCLMYMSSSMDKVVMSPSFTKLPQDLMLEIIQATTAKLSLSD